jgi:hypothetical protein
MNPTKMVHWGGQKFILPKVHVCKDILDRVENDCSASHQLTNNNKIRKLYFDSAHNKTVLMFLITRYYPQTLFVTLRFVK